MSAVTPRRIFLESAARERFAAVARACAQTGRAHRPVVPSYSVKTNPRAEMLALAREAGFLAETISAGERAWSAQLGFAADRTIANGPEPVVLDGAALAYAFADSVEALERNIAHAVARTQGVRLRPSMLDSRFGVPLADESMLHDALRALPAGSAIAVSFHARREDFHRASWRDVALDVVRRATALERVLGVAVTAFDVGGGWTPEEFDREFERDLRWLSDQLDDALPRCAAIIIEPGQAVATPAEAIETTVLEVRERRGRREAIIDAAYSDWPLMRTYAHRLYAGRDDGWQALGAGHDRIGGRTCLEYDAVDGVGLPADLVAGDRLLIADTGSYDRSMSFAFAGADVRKPGDDACAGGSERFTGT